MNIEPELLRKIIEGALMASSEPLNVVRLQNLFKASEQEELELEPEADDASGTSIPSKEEILSTLEDIQTDTVNRGFELKQVGSGWRFQVAQETAPWISRLWEEKPAKYSRALLETLSLIAYRQPITRGDIESIRGVAVSSNIIKTLTEREWVKVVGHRDVPGRPALYATTKEFLDYFNIKSLDELPSLKEIQDIDKAGSELELLMAAEQTDPDSTQQESTQEKEMSAENDNKSSFAEEDEDRKLPSNVVHLDTH